MFREAERYEFENVTPEISTRLAYPDPVDVSRIAFFFTAENKQTLPEAAHGETRHFVAAWQQAWTAQRRPELTYRRTRDAVFLDDARDRANPVSHAWYGPLAFAYEACAEPHTATEVHDALRREMALNCSREDVAEALDGFCQSGFMLLDKGSYLSLALPANPNW